MKTVKTKKQILEAVNKLTDSAIVCKYYACKTKQALHRLFEGKDNQITVENIKQVLLDEAAVKTLNEEKHQDALKHIQRRQYCASIATILPTILGVWSPSPVDRASRNKLTPYCAESSYRYDFLGLFSHSSISRSILACSPLCCQARGSLPLALS